jgi:gliding motility-associated-like protein
MSLANSQPFPVSYKKYKAKFTAYLLLCFISLLTLTPCSAQKIIITNGADFYALDQGTGYCFYSLLNVPTCFTKPQTGPFSMAMYRDTIYYNNLDGELYMSVLNTPSSCALLDTGMQSAAMTIDKNGILFLADYGDNLIKYDPHQRKKYNLGKLSYAPSGDLVFWRDQLIMATYEGLVNVNIIDPGKSTLFLQDTVFGFWGLANVSTACDNTHLIGFSGETVRDNGLAFVVEIDMDKKSFKTLCSLPNYAADAASIQEYGGFGAAKDTLFSSMDTFCCKGVDALLDAGGHPDATYLWDDNSDKQIRAVNTAGKYWVTVNNSGCITSDTINCVLINGPEIYLPKDTSLCEPGPVKLQPEILYAGMPSNSYIWQDGSTEDFYNVTKSGLYILGSTNTCGSRVDSAHIVFEDCNCTFVVPNAFTPNKDGVNDVFTPKPRCTLNTIASNYRFRVFNRLGQLVFSTSLINAGWDGRLNGAAQPMGTYVWELQYHDSHSQKLVNKNGTVILIR